MSNSSVSITFVLFTFNEEKRIERAIRNFHGFGRILVVDNESSDQTRDIALRYGCDVLINRNAGWVEDEVTTGRVRSAVTTPWIYWGFADEMVDLAAIGAILSAVNSGLYDIINIARKNYYYGAFCHDLFADRMNKIFKKDAIDFTGNQIHRFGRPLPEARIHALPLKYFVHHFISNTAKSYLYTMDRYTDTERTEKRSVPSLLRLFSSTVKTIVVNIVVRRGYQAGMPGFFLTAYLVFYRWLSAMKLYEKAAHLDRDTIEARNNVVRDEILRSLPRREAI